MDKPVEKINPEYPEIKPKDLDKDVWVVVIKTSPFANYEIPCGSLEEAEYIKNSVTIEVKPPTPMGSLIRGLQGVVIDCENSDLIPPEDAGKGFLYGLVVTEPYVRYIAIVSEKDWTEKKELNENQYNLQQRAVEYATSAVEGKKSNIFEVDDKLYTVEVQRALEDIGFTYSAEVGQLIAAAVK